MFTFDHGYPIEHYPFWKNEYPDKEMPHGMFGENLTMQGLLESEVYVGDRFKIGTVELIAVQPRLPCSKLGIKFGTQEIVKKFYDSDFPGIYFKVAKEGELQAGDAIELIQKDPAGVTIKDIFDLKRRKSTTNQLQQASKAKHLTPKLKKQIEHALKTGDY